MADQNERRTKYIKFRVTGQEREEIKKRVPHDIDLAVWLRDWALSGQRTKPRLRDVPQADPELVKQVAIIGNNLNQIARACNVDKKSGAEPDIINLLLVLNEQRGFMRQILDLEKQKGR